MEVGADAIHLVDETDARDVVLVRLAPHRFGLRLDARHRVEHRHRTVEHAQRALHLNGEIDVAWGVDDVDPVVAPIAGGRRGSDGDSALLLLLHPIHGGGAFMHLTDLIGAAGIIENALGRRGLAGIDMGHNADIAIAVERSGTGHNGGLSNSGLPAIMRKGPVGLRHAVSILTLLDRGAAIGGGVQ